MFSFASKNKTSHPGHNRSQSSSYLTHTLSEDTAYHGLVLDEEPSLPRPPPAYADCAFSIRPPPHNRSLTAANASAHSPPAPLITNFSKPTVYPQEPSLPASVFDPITDLDFELSPPTSPTASPSKDRWSFLGNFKPSPSEAGSPTKSVFSNRPASPSKNTDNRASRIADWFQGESAPISIGVVQTPSPGKETGNPMDNIPHLLPDMLTRKPTMASSAKSPQPTSSPFSLFTKPFIRSPTAETSPVDPNDTFLTLDAKSALLPESAQTFSPAAFKNLQQKAEGLLAKMQAAYKQRVREKAEAQQEVSAQREELEEANTRAQHLKQQLNDLSAKNAEQTGLIASLMEELAREKKARREDANSRTLRMVGDRDETPRRRKPRQSDASVDSSRVSDSGFESNADDDDVSSVHESVMSHGRETPATPTSLAEGREWKVRGTRNAGQSQGQSQGHVCINCQGRSSQSRAPSWALLGDLRTAEARSSENVRMMEGEIDKCLEMVEDAMLGLRM